MKHFDLHFHSVSMGDGKEIVAGIKILAGNPLDIGRSMGAYADQVLKNVGQPQMMQVILTAYWKFKELNPDMTTRQEQQIINDAVIIKP